VIKYDYFKEVVNILPADIHLENRVEGGEIKISNLVDVNEDIIITLKTGTKVEKYIITLEIPPPPQPEPDTNTGINFVRYFHFSKECVF